MSVETWTILEKAKGRKHGAEKSDARAAAILAGAKTYQGPACKYGHSGERYTRSKDCTECVQHKNLARRYNWTAPEKTLSADRTVVTSTAQMKMPPVQAPQKVLDDGDRRRAIGRSWMDELFARVNG